MSFRYHSDKTDFQCPLVESSCTQCGKKTLVEPLCPAHVAEKFGVAVRRSNIPDAGLGLFALRDINKNDLIVPPYTGTVYDANAIIALYKNGSAPYTLTVNHDRYIDAACKRSWAAFINHTTAKKTNARFVLWAAKQTINIRATKDIKAGSEILIHYGDVYFNFNDNVKTETVFTPQFEKDMQDAALIKFDKEKKISKKDKGKKRKRSKSPVAPPGSSRSNPIVV